MQLVPVFDDDNNEIGHVPNSSSKNPVQGVMHCGTCGAVATVHKASGKRSNQLYTICSNDAVDENGHKICGATNQEGGQARQALIKQVMRRTVEELNAEAITADSAGIEAQEHSAKADDKPAVKPEGIPAETADNAVSTVNSEPAPPPPQNPENKPKDKPIGLFAVLGAGIGGLLAFMM